MRFHNGLRCLAASLFAIATLTVASFGQVAASQTAKSQIQSAPTPAAAIACYRAVDAWVRDWRTPARVPSELSAMTGGAHVQLRLDGVLVGRGQAFPVPGEPGGTALMKATREAIEAAESRLQLPNDAMRDAALKEQASRIMISLDLAGPLISFEPATWAEAELGLSPGLEGVATAVRGGDGLTGMLASAFPSLLISTNTLPHRALGGLCAQTIGDGGAAAALEQPKQIRERHGLRMYRFRTTHLAQCKPGAEPVFLYRGARLIDQSEMTAAELRRMADEMAKYLIRAAAPDDKLPAESSALAALAMRAFAGPSGPQATELQRRSRAAMENELSRLCDVGRARKLPPAATLLLLLANSTSFTGGGSLGTCGMPTTSRIESLRRTDIMRPGVGGELLPGLPQEIQGLRCAVCATYPALVTGKSELVNPADQASFVEPTLRSAIAIIPHGQLVSHMPWLGWAEIELAKHKAHAGGKPADIPSAVALREMRKQVWEHQIGATDIDRDSMDLAGGIVFTKAASPLPTWQCTRPLAFIATMLADERLTEPQERAIELARLLQSLRFIRQLQADESIGWMAPNVDMAIGGVRAAPWDQSMPSDATSMALLTVVEALRSLDALSKPAAAAPPAADVPAANP